MSLLFVIAVNMQTSAQGPYPLCSNTTSTPLVNAGSFSVGDPDPQTTGGSFWGLINVPKNVTNSNLTDYATLTIVGTGSGSLTVQDDVAYGKHTFAGFVIESGLINLGVLSSVTVSTVNISGAVIESKSSSSLLSLGSSVADDAIEVGFHATQPFYGVKITFTAGLGVGTYRVYHAVLRKPCEGPDLTDQTACNVVKPLTSPEFPLSTEVSSALLAGVLNPNYAIDNLPNTAASLLVAAGEAELTVSHHSDEFDFPNGAFVGFEIEHSSLIDLSLLGTLTVGVYMDDDPDAVEESVGAQLLSVGLLTSGRQKIGIVTNKAFNKIKISNSAALAVTGPIQVFNAFVQPFCEGDVLDCNTPTALTSPEYPVFVNYQNTSVQGLLSGGATISGTDNVLNSASTDPATLNQLLAVGTPMSFSVKKGGTKYQGGEYVGFDVESVALLDVSLLETVTISTYRNDTLISEYGSSAMLVSAALLQVNDRQMIGVVTEGGKEFDEVKISFTNLLNLDPLGSIKIYRFVAETFCPVDLDCNAQYSIARPHLPAVIESTRTGFSSVACVNCEISGTANLVNGDPAEYASISVPVQIDLGASASISVRTPETEYPAGTMVGFTVESLSTLIELELFESLTITTYKDDNYVESRTAGQLIELSALIPILGTGPGIFNVGFMSSLPFDEVILTVGSLISANVLNELRVFNTFVNTSTAINNDGTLKCLTTNPDMNVAFIGVEIEGDVSTNDYVGAGQTVSYGTPVASSSNGTSTITMNSDGTYTFITNNVGVFEFDIPVCVGDQTGDECKTEKLVITVIDPNSTSNPPVANIDIVAMTASESPSPITINVKANDSPGSLVGTLSPPTVLPTPAPIGNAVVSGEGVNYTPAASFVGTDTFDYQIQESPSTLTASSSVVVMVFPEETSYVAASDDYNKTIQGESPLSVNAANGVLVNDRDSQGRLIEVSIASAGRTAATNDAGNVVFDANGGYVYTPASGFVGTGVFPYEVCNPDNVCSNATLYISVFDESVMPVTLVSFEASNEGNLVSLNWRTSEEVNVDRFEIERSLEGKKWNKIGSVTASGNSTDLKRYSFTDKNPSLGVNYYRLRSIDKDGSESTSMIRSIVMNKERGLSLFPNPVSNRFQIVTSNAQNITEATLISITGKKTKLSTTGQLSEFDISHLPAGIYHLTVTQNDGQTATLRILKK